MQAREATLIERRVYAREIASLEGALADRDATIDALTGLVGQIRSSGHGSPAGATPAGAVTPRSGGTPSGSVTRTVSRADSEAGGGTLYPIY